MRYIYTLLISIVFVLSLSGQNSRLANQYYNTGEYEKAAELYLKLFQKNNKSDTYFNRYIESLLAIEEYQQAEAAIKKEVKRRPSDTQLIVTYGNLFEKMGDTQEADKQYRMPLVWASSTVRKVTQKRWCTTTSIQCLSIKATSMLSGKPAQSIGKMKKTAVEYMKWL